MKRICCIMLFASCLSSSLIAAGPAVKPNPGLAAQRVPVLNITSAVEQADGSTLYTVATIVPAVDANGNSVNIKIGERSMTLDQLQAEADMAQQQADQAQAKADAIQAAIDGANKVPVTQAVQVK